MSQRFTERAIILKAYDVGEADRFCILFTEHHGKIAARARAVRKMKSRFGGSILPLQLVQAELTEGSAGYLITGATCLDTHDGSRQDLRAYDDTIAAIRLLLSLLPDDEPDTELFALTCDFFERMSQSHDQILLPAFTLRLLSGIGSLPSMRESVISHRPLGTESLCFSPMYGGFCLQAEDTGALVLSHEATVFMRMVLDFPFGELPSVSRIAHDEIDRVIGHLADRQSAVMSLPSRRAPLPVGSPATPTW